MTLPNDLLARIFAVVYAIHEHRGVILARRDWTTFLAPASRCFWQVPGQEKAGAFDHDIHTRFIPL